MNLHKLLEGYRIILASASPRRKQLLETLGLKFEIVVTNVDESYPQNMPAKEIAKFLSKKKADFFNKNDLTEKTIVITADTLVALKDKIIPKPDNKDEAKKYLKQLSNNVHIVYTGVTIKSKIFEKTFVSESKVLFNKLNDEEIEYYVDNFEPFDKAGAYGIQDWIGLVGIKKIDGSFTNVMGLPTDKLYRKLKKIVENVNKTG